MNEPYLLVVEDSPTQAEKLKYILEQNNHIVRSAENGKKALEIIKRQAPQIIISDIMMPEMDGFQLCKIVKDTPELREIPFMILTSLSDPHDVIKGLQAGADNFLTKPYNEQFLVSRVQYILANLELRRGMISSMGMEVVFAGQKYFINSDKMQIIDLLLSTYENAIQKNMELADANNELTEIHRELEMKNSQLEKANTEKNKFLGIVAHDIRNPLGAILSTSMVLEEELGDKVDDELKEMISLMKTSADFVIQLINELLDISVIESGNLQLRLQEEDIVSLVENNLYSNKLLAAGKNISLQFNADRSIPYIRLDKAKTAQVMNNLISNAIKYSDRNSKVVINISQTDEGVVIFVKDEGQGIPSNEIERLFKPFPKISTRATAGEKSTGLGLAIVRKIVEAHKGRVWAESEAGRGATFYVLLPKK